jgi:hypothetical protein
MLFFVRCVNPVIAVAVLVLCLLSAGTHANESGLKYSGYFKDPIQVYFLAKGLFCSTALLLLGTLVEKTMALLERRD